MSRRLLIGAAFLFACASTAAAQSGEPDLAAIARQAEAAKPTIPKAKKTYTNADLSPDGLPPAPVDSGFMSVSQGKPVSAEEMLKLSQAKADADRKVREPDEVWVSQATRIRGQVEKLSTRLGELRGLQKNPNAAQQKKIDQDIAMIQQQLEGLRKRWTGLEEAARTSKVNTALILPMPRFPS
jgi:hypothetical protein